MKKYLLFVCWHNSWRSQMAEVYFNNYNKNKNIEALSAWTTIKNDGKINPKVKKLLLEKWIDIEKQNREYKPKALDKSMIKNAFKIYTMWCMEGACEIWDRKIDYDFWLDDPALETTDINKMWLDFEEKIKPILNTYNK